MKNESKSKTPSDNKSKSYKAKPMHPGILFETKMLKQFATSTVEAAQKLDLPYEVVMAFCKGQQHVTSEIAEHLAVVNLHLPACVWVEMQKEFDDSLDAVKVASALDLAKAKFRDMNKVHELGTITEIAQKLGISKSEVRRRKSEGTLCLPQSEPTADQ